MTELQHYGVKGMRWGVRKRRPETDSERKYREYKSTVKQARKSSRSNISRAASDMDKAYAKYDSVLKTEKRKLRDTKQQAASKLDTISYSQVVRKKAKAMAPLIAATGGTLYTVAAMKNFGASDKAINRALAVGAGVSMAALGASAVRDAQVNRELKGKRLVR